MVRRIAQLFKYDQKSDWDKKALSYMKNCANILDAGCGVGRFISHDPARITGLENNPANIEAAAGRGFKVKQGNIPSMPFENESFDGIYSSHVIEHLTPEDLHLTLREFDRVLKEGGLLIIATPLLWKHFYSDLTHIKPYNPAVLVHYLSGETQRTQQVISTDYDVLDLFWRRTPLPKMLSEDYGKNIFVRFLRIKGILFVIDGILYKTGLNFFTPKNGYMLVLRKEKKRSA
ncbi:MAG: hypothetical protein UY41_C0054G0005 [Candidatus Moranbacteria bacterium GW2011_GWE1_49_15]|nr:MAG: hypothetical protein UY41_C0054G0005 [Candidatus Moranbacteria bacterium GW2011_GWE1_49_15]